ncbi:MULTISPECIES: hypothetical protein [unclassified Sphingomonas]|uniref:hypothetical protein n=1 Tax=unclassified Sphingomonas TaxID=196159 RepID=UPI0012E0E72E|nr:MULTISPECIES: hypothetical protein [unclassified Sphingomonas]
MIRERAAVQAASDEDRANWARLIDDHTQIAAQCIEIAELSQGPREQSGLASRKLIELAIAVAKHLDVEDEVIDRTVIAMEPRFSPDTIAMMEEDLEILRSDWKVFIGRWLPVISQSEWDKFGVQAKSMLDRLSGQVTLETEILYDHALRDGVVRAGGAVLH